MKAAWKIHIFWIKKKGSWDYSQEKAPSHILMLDFGSHYFYPPQPSVMLAVGDGSTTVCMAPDCGRLKRCSSIALGEEGGWKGKSYSF